MEKLKNQYDSSIQNQYSALREIRYISKHMKEPGKREMALSALTFFTFMSDDGERSARSSMDLRDFQLPRAHRRVQRRVAVLVPVGRVEAVVDEQLGDVRPPLEPGAVHRGVPMRVLN